MERRSERPLLGRRWSEWCDRIESPGGHRSVVGAAPRQGDGPATHPSARPGLLATCTLPEYESDRDVGEDGIGFSIQDGR